MSINRYSGSIIILLAVCSSISMGQSGSKGKLGTTSWASQSNNEVPFILEFQKNGVVLYVDVHGVRSKGVWKRRGKTIEIEVNRGSVRVKGVAENGRMKGASSSKGVQSEWVANIQPPVTKATSPGYPPLAAAARISGSVMIDVYINRDGKVGEARALNGHPLLRKASEEAARDWKFQAVDQDSLRVGRLLFTFRILDKKKDEAAVSPVFLSQYRIEIRRGIPSVEYSEQTLR